MLALLLVFVTQYGVKKYTTTEVQRDGYAFTLSGSTGPVSLSDFSGQYKLIFFGYGHCPDICPMTMSHISQAMSRLAEVQRKKVQVIFISVDPERDTVQYLREYVSFFYKETLGLTGTNLQIKQVARQFNVTFYKNNEQSDGGYEMLHTSKVFLLDGSDNLIDTMSHHTSAENIATTLKHWLNADH